MIKITKFISTLLLVFLVFNASNLRAAATVVAEGVTTITSTIDHSIYRKRAIENALQNIAINKGQALTSFTIVENGQMLIDQIQSTSKAGIVSFTVVKEYKKNNRYYVKVEAIVEDQHSQDRGPNLSETCRQTNFAAVDLSFKINIDPQQFPAWTDLHYEWISKRITREHFKPKLVLISGDTLNKSKDGLYTLFDDTDVVKKSDNIYQIDLDLNFTKAQKEAFFVKNHIIRLVAHSEIKRKGVQVENESQVFEFFLQKKFGTGIPIQSNKKIWEQEKQRIIDTIFSIINNKLARINCVFIAAKLKKNKDKYFINYGSLDGITQEDLFVVDTEKAEKFYFRVTELKSHITQLKLISDSNRIDFSNDQIIRIVEEL